MSSRYLMSSGPQYKRNNGNNWDHNGNRDTDTDTIDATFYHVHNMLFLIMIQAGTQWSYFDQPSGYNLSGL